MIDQRIINLTQDVMHGKVDINSLPVNDYNAIRTYAAQQDDKTPATKPLVATKQGQQTLQAQSKQTLKAQKKPKYTPPAAPVTQGLANVINAGRDAASQAMQPQQSEDPKTWGTSLDEGLSSTPYVGGAYDAIKKVLSNVASQPTIQNVFGTMGAPIASVGDFLGNLTDTSNPQLSFNAPKQFYQGVEDYFKNGNFSNGAFPNFSDIYNAGIEGIAKSSRPMLDTTKNIYARSAMSQGASPQLASKMADEWVRQNPNLAGTSSNLFNVTLDPLNLAGGEVAEGLKNALTKKAVPQAVPKKFAIKSATPTAELPLEQRQAIYDNLMQQSENSPFVQGMKQSEYENVFGGDLTPQAYRSSLPGGRVSVQQGRRTALPRKPTLPSGWSLPEDQRQALYNALAQDLGSNPDIERLVQRARMENAFNGSDTPVVSRKGVNTNNVSVQQGRGIPRRAPQQGIPTRMMPKDEQQGVYNDLFNQALRPEEQAKLDEVFGGDLSSRVSRNSAEAEQLAGLSPDKQRTQQMFESVFNGSATPANRDYLLGAVQTHFKTQMDNLFNTLKQMYPNVNPNNYNQNLLDRAWEQISGNSNVSFSDAIELAFPDNPQSMQDNLQKALANGMDIESILPKNAVLNEPVKPSISFGGNGRLNAPSFSQRVEQDLTRQEAKPVNEQKAVPVNEQKVTPINEQLNNDLKANQPVGEVKPKPKRGRKPQAQAQTKDLANQVGNDLGTQAESKNTATTVASQMESDLKGGTKETKKPNAVDKTANELANDYISGEISAKEYGQKMGLTDGEIEDFHLKQPATESASLTPYKYLFKQMYDVVENKINSLRRPIGGTQAEMNAYDKKISEHRNTIQTLKLLEKNFEHPFKNRLVSKLPAYLKTSFESKFENPNVKFGDAAREEYSKASYDAKASRFIDYAEKKKAFLDQTASTKQKPEAQVASEPASAQHQEIDDEISRVQSHIDELNSNYEKEVQDTVEKLWEDFKRQGKKANPASESIAEVVKEYGRIRIPLKGEHYYTEYNESFTSDVKRKYFTTSRDAQALDTYADQVGISMDDLIDKIHADAKPMVGLDEGGWIREYEQIYGKKPTKQGLMDYVKNHYFTDEHAQNVKALQDVIDELQQAKNDLPVTNKNQTAAKPKDDVKKSSQTKEQTATKETKQTTSKEPPQTDEEINARIAELENQVADRNKRSQQSKEQRSGIVASTGSNKNSFSNSELKSPNQLVNDVVNASNGRMQGDIRKYISDTWMQLKNAFKPKSGFEDNQTREIAFQGEKEMYQAPNNAEIQIRSILFPLADKSEYKLFNELVRFKDFLATKIQDPNASLPRGLTLEDARDEVNRLEKLAQKSDNVRKALQNYYDTMEKIALELQKRGILKLDYARKDYFPHVVMDYMDKMGDVGDYVGLNEKYRGYAKKRKGSERDLNGDFVDVIRGYLTKVHADNAAQDTLTKILDRENILHDVDLNKISREADRKTVSDAQVADPNRPKKDEFINNKAYDLMVSKGVSPSKARSIAGYLYKFQLEKDFRNAFTKYLKKEGINDASIGKIVQEAWDASVHHPKYQFRMIDQDPIMYNGKKYVFFKPKYSNEIYLIPEGVHKELKAFQEPLFTNNVARIAYKVGKTWKTTVLTLGAPARITVDTFSNATKLAKVDIKAFKYAPKAIKLMLMNSNRTYIKRAMDKIIAKQPGEVTQSDREVLKFLRDHGIIEPSQRIKGIFNYTPKGEKTLRAWIDPRAYVTYSRNATQKGDEFFKTMKALADYERAIKGIKNKITKEMEFHDPVTGGMVDISGLDKYFQVSKTANELFVDSARQSKLMKVIQLVVPFANWASTDALHQLRYIKANPKKFAATTATLVTGMAAWNNIGERRKQEEQLPEWKRQIPHLNTGYADEDGNPYIIYLPVFGGLTAASALGLSEVPLLAADVATGRTSLGDAATNAPRKIAETAGRNASAMLGPARLIAELAFNKSLYTGSDITPKGTELTSGGIAKKLEYALNELIPPARSYTTAQKQLDSAADDGTTATPMSVVGKSLMNAVTSPFTRFVKKEDKKQLAKSLLYDLARERRIGRDSVYSKLDDAVVAGLVTGDFSQVQGVLKGTSVDSRSAQSHIQNTWEAIVKKAIQKTDDPARKAQLQQMLKDAQTKNDVSLLRSAGVDNSAARNAYNTLQGGAN